MIAINELTSTLNRMMILQNNTDAVEEEIMASVIIQNLTSMIKQLEMMAGSPQFKQDVEREKERRSQNDT